MKELLIVLKNILLKKSEAKKNPIQDIAISENENIELIKNLKIYDIVYVKMKEEDIAQFRVKEGHTTRPFVIVRKRDRMQIVNGFYLTSNISGDLYFEQTKHKGLKIILTKTEYQQDKNSLILFQNQVKLPYENIIRYRNELKPKEINKLEKYINLLYHRMVISTKENKVIEIADIIIHENINYIIYQMDNTHCYGYPIIETNEKIDIERDFNYIVFNNKLYFIDYKNSRKFKNEDTLYIIDRFNEEIVEVIRHNKKKLKSNEHKKSKTKTKRKK